jgi:hypothetical protein
MKINDLEVISFKISAFICENLRFSNNKEAKKL